MAGTDTLAPPGPAAPVTALALAPAAAVALQAAADGGSGHHLPAQLELLGCCEHLAAQPELLAHSPLLQDFNPAEAGLLGGALLRYRARPGQVLIGEGEHSDWMMLLLRGTVDVCKHKPGSDPTLAADTTRLAVVKEGAVLGEMSMLDGEPRYASCIAITEVEAAVLTRSAVAELIRLHPAVGAKLLVKLTQLLAQRLRNTSNQVVKLLQKQ